MAAFLHEIKTAKLRRVRSGANEMAGNGGPSGLSQSVIVTSASTAPRFSAKELLRRRSLASLRVPIGSSLAAPVPLSVLATPNEPGVRVGQKRKADALGVDDVAGVPCMSHSLVLNVYFPLLVLHSKAPYDATIFFIGNEPANCCVIIRNIVVIQYLSSASPTADQ